MRQCALVQFDTNGCYLALGLYIFVVVHLTLSCLHSRCVYRVLFIIVKCLVFTPPDIDTIVVAATALPTGQYQQYQLYKHYQQYQH